MDSRLQRKRRQVDRTDVRMYDASLAHEFVRFFRLEEVSGTPGAYSKWGDAFMHIYVDESLPGECYDRLCLAARAVELLVVMKTAPSDTFMLRRMMMSYLAEAFGSCIFNNEIDTDPHLINPAVDECLSSGASTVDVMKLVLTVFSANMAQIAGF